MQSLQILLGRYSSSFTFIQRFGLRQRGARLEFYRLVQPFRCLKPSNRQKKLDFDDELFKQEQGKMPLV